jgi:glycosyltransferase involved in cell wall biosynthesis
MRLGVFIEETWDFFHEVYADFGQHHSTTLYKRPEPVRLPVFTERVNRHRFRSDLSDFIRRQDVLFFEWASELLAVASQMPKTAGIVTRLHRYEMYEWAERINWDAVDRVILVSDAKLRTFTETFPSHAHKAVVIPEAVSVTRFQPGDRKPFGGDIGILCHLKPRKRVYDLVLTFAELLEEGHQFHLHIGGGLAPGSEDYYEALHGLVGRLGLQDKVTFYGHQSKPEQWYPLIDVFVSNSFSEGLQVSPMEAMASGCHCVSHRWAGAEELLPDSHLYDTNAQLKRLLVDHARLPDAERAALRTRMRNMVTERFNVDVTKAQIRGVVEDVYAARGGGR